MDPCLPPSCQLPFVPQWAEWPGCSGFWLPLGNQHLIFLRFFSNDSMQDWGTTIFFSVCEKCETTIWVGFNYQYILEQGAVPLYCFRDECRIMTWIGKQKANGWTPTTRELLKSTRAPKARNTPGYFLKSCTTSLYKTGLSPPFIIVVSTKKWGQQVKEIT